MRANVASWLEISYERLRIVSHGSAPWNSSGGIAFILGLTKILARARRQEIIFVLPSWIDDGTFVVPFARP